MGRKTHNVKSYKRCALACAKFIDDGCNPKLTKTHRNKLDPSLATTPFEDKSKRRPLPEFIPSSSWSDLELNEMLVEFETVGKATETRAFLPQIIENCPGKISKRFSSSQRENGYWLRGCAQFLSDQQPSQIFEISNCFSDFLLVSQVDGINVIQPQTVTYNKPPTI